MRKSLLPKSWQNWNNVNDDADNRSLKRDGIYQEITRRRSSYRSGTSTAPSTNSGPPLRRTETTVKLRKVAVGGRRVFVNLPLPKYELNKKDLPKQTYASNRIRTSKYTVITFVPKNLFEQFRRPANLYFLIMAIISMLPQFNVGSPALALLPICCVVVITAIKDAIEDLQRHKVDEQYNQNVTHTLKGYRNTNYPGSSQQTNCLPWFSKKEPVPPPATINANSKADVFQKSLSKDVRVGDFILLRNGDSLPADAIILSTSDKDGICFVETKDLDGETNLKPRKSMEEYKHVQSGADCLNDCHFYVEAGPPSADLYNFEGTLVTLEQSEGSDKWNTKNKSPVSIDNMLLRGHVIRNTKWIIAVVLFTGTDTKIMLNSGETPSKRSTVDIQMNTQIFIAFIILFILCLVCAIMCGVMRARFMSRPATSIFNPQTGSPGYVGFMNFWSSLIIFQNIIPISLYVSIEFVKTFQAFFIWNDIDMWDKDSKKTCVPKTWTLSDDLGQVEYIFSDKTGTLTRNVMEFRECTIGGKRYGDNGFSPESEGARGARLRKEKEEAKQNQNTSDEENQTPSTVPTDPHDTPLLNIDEDPLSSNDEKQADEKNKQRRNEIMDDYEDTVKKLFHPKYSSMDPDRLSFADPQLFKDIKSADINTNVSDKQSETIKEFFMLLSLCHSVVIERIGEDGKVIEEEEEDDDKDAGEGGDQPKIDDDDDDAVEDIRAPTAGNTIKSGLKSTFNASSASINKSFAKVRDGSNKLLQVPGFNSLKKNSNNTNDTAGNSNKKNELHRTKTRGSEFSAITDEGDNSNKFDKTVQEMIRYKAESPDEAALVAAAKDAGFTFIKKKGKTLTVDILGKEYEFELLEMLEFNSDRKRMSVILRRPAPWNDIILYCKGADNVIAERLDKQQEGNIYDETMEHVNTFSENGLRTLLLAYRVLNEDEFEKWQDEMNEASTSSENRAENVAEVQEHIEKDLKLIGATAIEDKLQEGVPQCIEGLRNAGIKIWVLTGDKLETAINIGYASNLLDAEMKLRVVRGSDNADKVFQSLVDTLDGMLKYEERQQEGDEDAPPRENALVIEGSALTHIFESSEPKEKLIEIATRCKSVVCCRVSPLQKAFVVELVRKYHKVVTLAVGDGANDVSMIQVANVGVGIAGQEGVQASMAADYAISQFRFLHKLLLVQGHWSYHRVSEMILNFFYKNIFWVFPSLWYQIYSAWSGNLFYDYSFIQLYNIIFTVAPAVIIGCTDQDLIAPYLKHLPAIYTIRGKLYTKFRFWLYFFDGVWQSVVVFFAFYFTWIGADPNSNGHSESMLQLSTSVAVTNITLANLMPGFNTYYWTWWQFTFIGIEILLVYLWVVIYGAFTTAEIYGMATMVFGQGYFWLTYALAIVVALLPRYIVTFIYQWWFPNVVAKGRHLALFEKRVRKQRAKQQQKSGPNP
ncbi:hypothetical protein BDF20DRAFT_911396 [Mycotypha africana]|uniref:uncharacterized protein n=1 Tax=Mycotypha africana TaxID=64632 RepID=UPI00230050CE|nr:uncharacterized protein BDF20DRAFT_911396 [Mycotypha africana]KAI8984278.1 hypothetical protein BDF20DRAFT_911396 [Mycotypha africana]